MIFHIFGHPNVLSIHYNTLEFTKDSELSKKGDCILGVKADFDAEAVKHIAKNFHEAKVLIKANDIKEEITIILNKDFDDSHEIVLRKSDYPSKRTLGLRASKSAGEINRQLVEILKNPETVATVEIKGILKP